MKMGKCSGKTDDTLLIVLPNGKKGGAESVAYQVARGGKARGWAVTMIFLSGPETDHVKRLRDDGIVCVMLGFRSYKLAAICLPSMPRVSSNEKPWGVIYSSHVYVNAATSLLRRIGLLQCKRLVSRESTNVFARFSKAKCMFARLVYRYLYGGQDLMISQTHEMMRDIELALGRSPARSHVAVPNPVGILPEKDGSHRFQEPMRVVAFGRLIPIKGFDRLIRSIHVLRQRGYLVNLSLGGDGPESESLSNLIADFGLADQVCMVGTVEDVGAFLRSGDIGAVPSLTEGFPNTLLEMMSAGVPEIICTRCTESIDRIPLIRVPEGFSAEHLADAIQACIESRADNSILFQKYTRDHHSIDRLVRTVLGEEEKAISGLVGSKGSV